MRPFNLKQQSIQLYKPHNLDLIKLAKNTRNPALAGWIDKMCRVRLKDGTTKSLRYNLAKLLLFCTKLLEQKTFNKPQASEQLDQTELIKIKPGKGPYFNLSNETLAKFLNRNDIAKVVRFLVELGVIEVNSVYSPGRFCKSYRFTSKYAFSQRKMIDSELPRCFAKRTVENWRKSVYAHCNPRDEYERWLVKCLKQLRLRPEAQPSYVGDILQLPDSSIMDIWKFKKENTTRAKSDVLSALEKIHEWASPEDTRFPNHVVMFNPSNVTWRFYTNITQLKREARGYLLYRNAPLQNIDVNAAHPFLLLKFYNFFKLGQVRVRNAEAKKYYSLWRKKDSECKRDFYDSFKSLTGIQATRSELKESFLVDFVNIRKPRKLGIKIAEAFKTHFPLLADKMDKVKSRKLFDYDDPYWTGKRANKEQSTYQGQMAVQLQRWEAEVMLEKAARHIYDEDRYWITPVHDALLCQARYADKAKATIVEAFRQFVGYKPNVKIESLTPYGYTRQSKLKNDKNSSISS